MRVRSGANRAVGDSASFPYSTIVTTSTKATTGTT
jgi:hypothetical protein